MFDVKFLIFIFIFCFSIQNINSFKPDAGKNEVIHGKLKPNSNYKKDCKIQDKCRECTFEELKTTVECQTTGYKQISLCGYYDGNNLIDEIYNAETCSENTKVNSVYYLLCICIVIGIFSWFIRKSHRNFLLKQMFEKLTILKDKGM
jgi:hypothetical protein